MANFTRDEIEAAFEQFQAAAVIGGSTGDWTEWSMCFTEDARYYEHHYGQYEGRAAILEWITTTMAEPLNRDMVAFPIDWYVIDEARGWVICASTLSTPPGWTRGHPRAWRDGCASRPPLRSPRPTSPSC